MSPQQSIAHYRINSKLGEGAMGAVYRATDTKLNRDVAVKVLPETFANDPDRLARFTREAQVLASLNHPNIAAIYGVEDRALIMELIEGEDLKGPVAVDTAIQYAIQIATGLEAAHEKGVVHRDLKPANIKVTPQGVIKVLDFGLAAVAQGAISGSGDSSATMTIMGSTQAGMILGTPSYMSPEQAAGKVVDKRADIWSFGVVLYELLTGKLLFEGETVSHTLAEVLKGTIDLSTLPTDTPPAVRKLLKRCLDRNLANRLRDIGEARVALQTAGQEAEPAAAATAPPAPARRRDGSGPRWPAYSCCSRRSCYFGSGNRVRRRWAPRHATLDLRIPRHNWPTIRFGRPHLTAMAFSRDGKTLVFSSTLDKISNPAFTARTRPERCRCNSGNHRCCRTILLAGRPMGSGFFAGGKLKKVALNRRSARGHLYRRWGAVGRHVGGRKHDRFFEPRPGAGFRRRRLARHLLAVDANKGAVYSVPEFLPDGKTLLFARRNESCRTRGRFRY